jgi:hypothetical protein
MAGFIENRDDFAALIARASASPGLLVPNPTGSFWL